MMKVISEKMWRTKYIGYFKVLCQFLNDNDIKYSLAFGSLLGCIREEGMIKWDYDIDFFIDSENVEKIKLLTSSLPACFSFKSDVESGIGLHRIIIRDLYEIYNNCLFNCFFDFFEYVGVNEAGYKNAIQISTSFQKLSKHFYSRISLFNPISTVIKAYYRLRWKDPKCLMRYKINKIRKDSYSHIFTLYKSLIFERPNAFLKMLFENIEVNVFDNYHSILCRYFGDDYLIPKKKEEYNPAYFIFLEDETSVLNEKNC